MHDAIIINRTMATGNNLEKLGIEPMEALFQNENHFWGKVEQIM